MPPVIGSAPKTMACLSVSETKTCKATVGALSAPDISDKATALVVKPLFSVHKYTPPPRTLINRFSPKLSCDHKRN